MIFHIIGKLTQGFTWALIGTQERAFEQVSENTSARTIHFIQWLLITPCQKKANN